MRAALLLAGLLSIARNSVALPTNEVFESLRELPQGWTQVRAPAPETRIHLRVALDQPNQELFEQTLLAVSTPEHPQYGEHLSASELKALLKPRDSSTDSILTWLQGAKIPLADIDNDGEWINFYASVATAEEIMSTKFYVYKHEVDNKEMIRTLQYSVPRAVSSHILTIQPTTRFSRMLTERNTVHEVDAHIGIADHHRKVPDVPLTPLNVTACNDTITPACLRALYNVGDYQADPNTRSLFGVAGYLEEWAKYDDLETFTDMYAPYAAGANFSAVSIKGGLNEQAYPSTQDDVEANLDIQYAVSMSYNVPVVYYSTGGRGILVPDLDQPDINDNSNEPYLEYLTYMLKLPNSELPQTITTSYGEDEQSVPAQYAKTVCNMFGQLGARGVSILFSSGDTGVGSACQTNDGKNTTRFLPIFPAACPWVTSVGGTRNVEPEQAVYFSSGGFSDLFPRPKYQDVAVKNYLHILGDQWKGLYNPKGRGFPDVSAQGYRYHVITRKGGATQKDVLVGGTRYFSLPNSHTILPI